MCRAKTPAAHERKRDFLSNPQVSGLCPLTPKAECRNRSYTLYKDNLMSLLAPEHVQTHANSTSTMEVTIAPPNITLSISFYRASAGNSSCEVSANMSPLSCLITGLSSGSRFNVRAFACSSSGVCSAPAVVEGYTLPDGNN